MKKSQRFLLILSIIVIISISFILGIKYEHNNSNKETNKFYNNFFIDKEIEMIAANEYLIYELKNIEKKVAIDLKDYIAIYKQSEIINYISLEYTIKLQEYLNMINYWSNHELRRNKEVMTIYFNFSQNLSDSFNDINKSNGTIDLTIEKINSNKQVIQHLVDMNNQIQSILDLYDVEKELKDNVISERVALLDYIFNSVTNLSD
ncbi:hypothetical protein AN1V17_00660 [Vallitalea sediminicola]